MQEISTSITISIDDYNKMLIESHEYGRYLGDMFKLRREIEALRKENEELRLNIAHCEKQLADYEKELAGDTDT